MNILAPVLKEIDLSTSEFEKYLLYYAQIGGEVTCEKRLLLYLKHYGEIVGLDKWASDQNIDRWWVRHCAHQAEAKGMIRMTRLIDKQGQPYRVTLQEEKHETKTE